MFEEAALLARALRRWGGARGFLRWRLEADCLHAELLEEMQRVEEEGANGSSNDDAVDDGGGTAGGLPLSLAARLGRAQRAELAAGAGVAWSAGALADTREAERWWTLPAALAGFNLRLAHVMDAAVPVPRRRYQPPHRYGGLRGRQADALACTVVLTLSRHPPIFLPTHPPCQS